MNALAKIKSIGDDFRESFGPGMLRKALLATAATAALQSCTTTKEMDVKTDPPGAEVSIYSDRKDLQSLVQEGMWIHVGETPIEGFEYYTRRSDLTQVLIFPMSIPMYPFALLVNLNKGLDSEEFYAVFQLRIEKEGYFENVRSFKGVDMPDEATIEIKLVPKPRYSFTLSTDPEGASVEYLEPIRVNGRLTDNVDYVFRGNTPLDEKDYIDHDADGLLTVRLTKPGFEETKRNISLGEKRYVISLGRN